MSDDDIVIVTDVAYQRDGVDLSFEDAVVMYDGDELVLTWELTVDGDEVKKVEHRTRVPRPPKRLE